MILHSLVGCNPLRSVTLPAGKKSFSREFVCRWFMPYFKCRFQNDIQTAQETACGKVLSFCGHCSTRAFGPPGQPLLWQCVPVLRKYVACLFHFLTVISLNGVCAARLASSKAPSACCNMVRSSRRSPPSEPARPKLANKGRATSWKEKS